MKIRELRMILRDADAMDDGITCWMLQKAMRELDQDEEVSLESLKPLTTKSSYKATNYDDETYTDEFPGTTSKDKFFNSVSHTICFSDITYLEVSDIIFRGVEYKYVGWQPDMVYEYHGADGDVWIGQFPEWDH